MAQSVGHLALCLQQLRSLLWLRFDLWPGNFCVLWVQPKKKKKKKKKKKGKKGKNSVKGMKRQTKRKYLQTSYPTKGWLKTKTLKSQQFFKDPIRKWVKEFPSWLSG